MIEIGKTLSCILFYVACIASHPHYNDFSRNPYTQGIGLFNYPSQIPYNTYIPTFPEPDLAFYFSQQQPLNIIAETPQIIGSTFSVIPMFAIPKNQVNMVPSSANIMGTSQKQPMLTMKTEKNSLLQCIPGVRIELEQPMWIYATKKTSIVFPSEVLIQHGGFRIPLRVGAVLAPINQDAFFYNQIPVEIRVVYAVPLPSNPLVVETITQEVQNIVTGVDNQAVVVDSNPVEIPQIDSGIFAPPNVTVVDFPSAIASPSPTFIIGGIGEDDELVNRNPPQAVIPAGIVQSSQPEITVETFHNSKESPVLTELKKEKLKQKLKIRQTEEVSTLVNNETTTQI